MPPFHGRQFFATRDFEQIPFRNTLEKTIEEHLVLLGHVGDKVLDQPGMRITKGINRQVSRHHRLEAVLVVMRNIPTFTRKEPMRGAAVADQIHDQRSPELGRNPSGAEQFVHIE